MHSPHLQSIQGTAMNGIRSMIAHMESNMHTVPPSAILPEYTTTTLITDQQLVLGGMLQTNYSPHPCDRYQPRATSKLAISQPQHHFTIYDKLQTRQSLADHFACCHGNRSLYACAVERWRMWQRGCWVDEAERHLTDGVCGWLGSKT